MCESPSIEFLTERKLEIEQRLSEAASVSGRALLDIDVVAVSKTVDAPAVERAFQVGFTHFGENRPQELTRKLQYLGEKGLDTSVVFDMIGNLQTNKINQVLQKVRYIQSVSSLHLAQNINKRAEARDMCQQVLLEVNVSGELSKSGFSPQELKGEFEQLLSLSHLEILGFMTMAPKGNKDIARKTFSDLRELSGTYKENFGLELPHLSCGMSDDFEIAVEEGSNIVRLGRVIFDNLYNLV